MNQDAYLDALLALPRLGPTAISRDGAWVAWTWFGSGPAADVYAAPTDGSAEPTRLTETDEETIVVSWTPDGRAVIVEQDQGGDERYRLFRVDLERPGVLTPLTESSPPYFLRGGQLHPKGRWLVYAMNYDVERSQEIEPTWVYRHDLETGERRVLACPHKPAFFDPILNDSGSHILYQRQDLDPGGSQVWLVDIEGQEDREIVNVGADKKAEADWFPDGRRVLVLAETETHRRLGVWDLESESIRWLIDDPSRNIEVAYAPRGVDGSMVVIVEIQEARTQASLLDVDSGIETPMHAAEGSLLPLRPVGNGEWVGRFYHSTQPADLVRFHLGEADLRTEDSLTRIWDQTSLRRADLVAAEDSRWRSADGLEIQGWLYRTPEPARGTIAYIHGGPTAHSENAFSAQIQFLVAQGFNVLLPNYRGSTGFSLEFQESIKEDGWGGREQDDIRTGIEALITSGIAQEGQVGITGTSYGGYSSWCAITRWPPSVIAASAPICGMTDLVVDYETTRPDLRPYSEEMMGGTPEEVPERYRERSPINFVDRIRGKLLIVQGLRDPNVTPENVRAVREALDRAGIEYEVLAFEDEGHGVMRPANQRVLYRRLAEFFSEAFA